MGILITGEIIARNNQGKALLSKNIKKNQNKTEQLVRKNAGSEHPVSRFPVGRVKVLKPAASRKTATCTRISCKLRAQSGRENC